MDAFAPTRSHIAARNRCGRGRRRVGGGRAREGGDWPVGSALLSRVVVGWPALSPEFCVPAAQPSLPTSLLSGAVRLYFFGPLFCSASLCFASPLYRFCPKTQDTLSMTTTTTTKVTMVDPEPGAPRSERMSSGKWPTDPDPVRVRVRWGASNTANSRQKCAHDSPRVFTVGVPQHHPTPPKPTTQPPKPPKLVHLLNRHLASVYPIVSRALPSLTPHHHTSTHTSHAPLSIDPSFPSRPRPFRSNLRPLPAALKPYSGTHPASSASVVAYARLGLSHKPQALPVALIEISCSVLPCQI